MIVLEIRTCEDLMGVLVKIAQVGIWISSHSDQLKSGFKIMHRSTLLQILHVRCCGTVKGLKH